MFRSQDHLQGAILFLAKVTCEFSKEQCSSLKMILGSKHVGRDFKCFNVKKKCMCISWCAN